MEAVQRAAYEHSNLFACNIGQDEECIWVEIVEDDYLVTAEIEKKFREAVLDNQLRIVLENKFGAMRDLLVAKAIESSLKLPFGSLSRKVEE
ncbi:His-Xaa-Ser system protein HxsD [Desulfobaculum xiamenense]|uniref:His-Xaa-Ser system protein HxsD n=1 Tax=Desulfobaculum xiamenense TaxID=995050 RepID=A0A846QL49_9BACT|nr:hypothetical protein [Desulfobaculum xiamenense]NJB67182.1 His-Xaa-Ser system protein HxsD [Desulfobaculum xiamenense]